MQSPAQGLTGLWESLQFISYRENTLVLMIKIIESKLSNIEFFPDSKNG